MTSSCKYKSTQDRFKNPKFAIPAKGVHAHLLTERMFFTERPSDDAMLHVTAGTALSLVVGHDLFVAPDTMLCSSRTHLHLYVHLPSISGYEFMYFITSSVLATCYNVREPCFAPTRPTESNHFHGRILIPWIQLCVVFTWILYKVFLKCLHCCLPWMAVVQRNNLLCAIKTT